MQAPIRIAVSSAEEKSPISSITQTSEQAQIVETRGAAEVQAKFAVENEEALGLRRRAAAFKDPSLWADLTFADRLNPDVTIRVIHAGEGTLWTDLKGAALAVPAPSAPKSP